MGTHTGNVTPLPARERPLAVDRLSPPFQEETATGGPAPGKGSPFREANQPLLGTARHVTDSAKFEARPPFQEEWGRADPPFPAARCSGASK
jgi:hypothetical protein